MLINSYVSIIAEKGFEVFYSRGRFSDFPLVRLLSLLHVTLCL